MNAAILPGSLPTNAFLGYPVSSFRAEERRSLTVHISDPGHWDVLANEPTESGEQVWAGRYESFDDAHAIACGLNRVWQASPQSLPSEVLAFVAKRNATAELLRACEHFRDTVAAMTDAERDSLPNGIMNTLSLTESAIAKADGRT